MIIGGLQKFSLLDYPGQVSAIVFTQGCNFRCPFCYNPMLVMPVEAGKSTYPSSDGKPEGHHLISEDDLFAFLLKRKSKLGGIVITGGEPTIHADLPQFLEKIKKIGYCMKLDTNGTNPKMLCGLIKGNLVDYIAMDIKSPRSKYAQTTGTKIDPNIIEESIKIIMDSGLPYEFRTTIVPGLMDKEDMIGMGAMIKGAKAWFLQQFKPDTSLWNPQLQKTKPYSHRILKEMEKIGNNFVENCEIR